MFFQNLADFFWGHFCMGVLINYHRRCQTASTNAANLFRCKIHIIRGLTETDIELVLHLIHNFGAAFDVACSAKAHTDNISALGLRLKRL